MGAVWQARQWKLPELREATQTLLFPCGQDKSRNYFLKIILFLCFKMLRLMIPMKKDRNNNDLIGLSVAWRRESAMRCADHHNNLQRELNV